MQKLTNKDYLRLYNASKYTPTYARNMDPTEQKEINFNMGHFDCNCNVPSLIRNGGYATLMLPIKGNHINKERVGLVIRVDDAYWLDHNNHWALRAYNYGSPPYQLYNSFMVNTSQIMTQPELYVRLIKRPGEQTEHINSNINISEEFELYFQEPLDTTIYHYTGVGFWGKEATYINPETVLDDTGIALQNWTLNDLHIGTKAAALKISDLYFQSTKPKTKMLTPIAKIMNNEEEDESISVNIPPITGSAEPATVLEFQEY